MRRFSTLVETFPRVRATTVLCVKKSNETVIMADGQLTLGSVISKSSVKKVRKIANGQAVIGFAGAATDCMAVVNLLEKRLESSPGQLAKTCVDVAMAWRTDRAFQRVQANVIVADPNVILMLTGDGNVLEPQDGVLGTGSGGDFAVAAARALYPLPEMTAEEICRRAMRVAADMCIYTNHNFISEKILSE